MKPGALIVLLKRYAFEEKGIPFQVNVDRRQLPKRWADLLLFEPGTVGRGPKHRVFDLPGGAPRLTTDAIGVHGVWVNGALVADHRGLAQQAPLAGRLLTEFAA